MTDENFTSEDFREGLKDKDFDNCVFTSCSFVTADLSNLNFFECIFISCDFSNAKFSNTSLKEVMFKNSKLLGIDFSVLNPFLLSFSFEGCILNYSSFFKLKIKKTNFKKCSLLEVDFAEAKLEESVFSECDLSGAIFEYTNLEKADFRESVNYILDPEKNKIKAAHFSKDGIAGLLIKYNIKIDQ